MFTGLVEATGEITQTRETPSGRRLVCSAPGICTGVKLGDSIAVNGCCLTVVEHSDQLLGFDVGPETLARTNLRHASVGEAVNLERSLAVGDRLGGHIVQGHIDGTAKVESRRTEGDWEIVRFSAQDLAPSMVPKGSVAVDGVSLTIAELTADTFTVMLIPHTMAVTTLGRCVPGREVNIELDILGKYVLRLLGNMVREGGSVTLEKLRSAGILA